MKAEHRLFIDVIYHQNPCQILILNDYICNILNLKTKGMFKKARSYDNFKEDYEHIGFNAKYRMQC